MVLWSAAACRERSGSRRGKAWWSLPPPQVLRRGRPAERSTPAVGLNRCVIRSADQLEAADYGRVCQTHRTSPTGSAPLGHGWLGHALLSVLSLLSIQPSSSSSSVRLTISSLSVRITKISRLQALDRSHFAGRRLPLLRGRHPRPLPLSAPRAAFRTAAKALAAASVRTVHTISPVKAAAVYDGISMIATRAQAKLSTRNGRRMLFGESTLG